MLRFHFGRFKGCLLSEVPDHYLVWCLGKLHELDPAFRDAMQRELDHRGQESERPRKRRRRKAKAQSQSSDTPLADLSAVIGRARRRLAMEHHPDRGGNPDVMRGINAACDLVEQLLEDCMAAQV